MACLILGPVDSIRAVVEAVLPDECGCEVGMSCVDAAVEDSDSYAAAGVTQSVRLVGADQRRALGVGSMSTSAVEADPDDVRRILKRYGWSVTTTSSRSL